MILMEPLFDIAGTHELRVLPKLDPRRHVRCVRSPCVTLRDTFLTIGSGENSFHPKVTTTGTK